MSKYVGFRQGKVHERRVISEYYCGGCGWPVTDHDSFCPECGGAFRKCDADDESIRRLEAENAKLRELVRKYGEYTDQDRCEGCVCKSRCNDGDIEECWQLTKIRELARKLGVEANV